MEIETTKDIAFKYNLDIIKPDKKWVAIDDIVNNIKIMKEIWQDDNLNEEDFDNLIKTLSQT